MKTQKKTNKYVKKHTEKTLQEGYEAEFFQALGQSFQPIVDSISSVFNSLSTVAGDALTATKSTVQDASSIAGEIRSLIKHVQDAKGEFDKSLSGFTKDEQKFFKEKLVEALKMLLKDPKNFATNLAQLLENNGKLEKEIDEDFKKILLYAGLAREYNIVELLKHARKIRASKKRKSSVLEETDFIDYRGEDGSWKRLSRQEVIDKLLDPTKIKDVFDLIAANHDHLIEYIKQELARLKKYEEKGGPLGSVLQRSALFVLRQRVKRRLNNIESAVELLDHEDFREDHHSIYTAHQFNKSKGKVYTAQQLNLSEDKKKKQQELKEYKEFLKDRRLI